MTLAIKVSTALGVPAGVGVFLLEAAAQTPGLTGSPVVDGLIGGGTVTAVTLAVMKTRLDRVEKDIAGKASHETVTALRDDMREMRDDIKTLLSRVGHP